MSKANSDTETVHDIVSRYLTQNGYDGLCCPGECACLVGDLCPCDGMYWDCHPGHKEPCKRDDDCPCDGDCDWHIVAGRKTPPPQDHEED